MTRKTRSVFILSLILGVAGLTTGSCAKDVPTLEIEEGPVGEQPIIAGGMPGTVLETMDADRYTYVRVDLGDEEIWAAAPHFEVAEGDQIVVPPGVPMQDFHSKSMDRTFEVIYFVDQIVPEGGDVLAAGMPPGHPAISHPEAESVAGDVSDIEKAAEGYTVAEVYGGKVELAGQAVTLRGQVVKVNQGILGSNWLHIQDGTGSAADGTNDLTVTTNGLAAVGQTVLITGTLELDRDFGAGYRYPVIVTGAEVTIE